jgi:hypothetical protein
VGYTQFTASRADHDRGAKMKEFRTVQLTPEEGKLRDAEELLRWALRHGNPSDVRRARRYLAEAKG